MKTASERSVKALKIRRMSAEIFWSHRKGLMKTSLSLWKNGIAYQSQRRKC